MKLHYFRPKKQKKGLLYQVFIIVAIIQIALLIGFSGMVITQSIIKEETVMQAPPTQEQVKPAEQEYRVKVERTQKNTKKLNKALSIFPPIILKEFAIIDTKKSTKSWFLKYKPLTLFIITD